MLKILRRVLLVAVCAEAGAVLGWSAGTTTDLGEEHAREKNARRLAQPEVASAFVWQGTGTSSGFAG